MGDLLRLIQKTVRMVKKIILFFFISMSTLLLPAYVSATVLLDQPLSAVNTSAYPNQDYEIWSDNPESDIWIADDFLNNQTWDISTIFVPGDFTVPRGTVSTLMGATALHWMIYADAGGKPDGDPHGRGNSPFWAITLTPSDTQVQITTGSGGYQSNTTLNLTSPVRIPPGHWWLAFYPTLNHGNYGEQGRQPADTTNNVAAQLIQATGWDNYPTVWTSVLDIKWAMVYGELTQQDFAFRLEGNIAAGKTVVSPAFIDFSSTLLDETSAAKTLTISNTGNTSIIINRIAFTGASANMFTVNGTGGANPCNNLTPTISPGGSCDVVVTFTPSALDAQSAALEVTSYNPITDTVQALLSGTGVEALLSVTEGTIGTQFTVDGPDFGAKKGKVLIENTATKLAKNGWTKTKLTCTMKKGPLIQGIYDVNVKRQPYKAATPIVLSGAFTVRFPEIDTVSPSHGDPETPITITGRFFGTKKGKVYLGEQKCRVTFWEMIPTTGASTIRFEVPKKLGTGSYSLKVVNKVGTAENNFTVD